MKSLVIFLFMIAVTGTRENDVDITQLDLLSNHKLNDGNSNFFGRVRRDTDDNEESENSKVKVSSIIELPPGYNAFKIPRLDLNPLSVFVHLKIYKILDIDELKESITLDVGYKMIWEDRQLIKKYTPAINITTPYDDLSIAEKKTRRTSFNNPSILAHIWKPILFIEQLLEVKEPNIINRPIAVRYIGYLGRFEYLTRIHIKLDCSMDFQYYPADTQSCLAVVRPVSYTKQLMNLKWFKNGVAFNDLELSNYRARVDDLTYVELTKTPDEVYDALQFKIFVRRKLSYHLTQTYMSSSFYIIITTLCFLLPSTMVEARIGISMTTLLTLTAMFASVRESTPIVSYTKAIDVWMVGCIFFVFLTLLQFTFHTWLKHVKKYKPKVENVHLKGIKNVAYEMDNASKIQSSEPVEEIDLPEMEPAFSPQTIRMLEKVSHFLESYSFVLFLAIFFAFSAIYWIWLLTAANYFHWVINPTWNNV